MSEVTLEEFDDRVGEVESFGLVENVLTGKLVGHEELGKVSDDLGRGGDLDNISTLYRKYGSVASPKEALEQ